MARPLWEVADVIRMAGSKLWERLEETLSWGQLKVLHAIVSCRTAAFGGHRDRCASCGYQAISFCSCHNRHCLKRRRNIPVAPMISRAGCGVPGRGSSRRCKKSCAT